MGKTFEDWCESNNGEYSEGRCDLEDGFLEDKGTMIEGRINGERFTIPGANMASVHGKVLVGKYPGFSEGSQPATRMVGKGTHGQLTTMSIEGDQKELRLLDEVLSSAPRRLE